MTKQSTIAKLKNVIKSKQGKFKFAAHIVVTPDTTEIIVHCAVCKANGIVGVAKINNDSPIMDSEIKRINWNHRSCGEKYVAPVFSAEPADEKLSNIKTQIIGLSLTHGEAVYARTVKAVEKAVTEFQENESIRFLGGKLTFISRDSGKQRIVTKFGCHESCECKGELSYHSCLYRICEAMNRSNIVSGNFSNSPTPHFKIPCKSGQFCWQLKSIARSIGKAEFDGYCGNCADFLAEDEMAYQDGLMAA